MEKLTPTRPPRRPSRGTVDAPISARTRSRTRSGTRKRTRRSASSVSGEPPRKRQRVDARSSPVRAPQLALPAAGVDARAARLAARSARKVQSAGAVGAAAKQAQQVEVNVEEAIEDAEDAEDAAGDAVDASDDDSAVEDAADGIEEASWVIETKAHTSDAVVVQQLTPKEAFEDLSTFLAATRSTVITLLRKRIQADGACKLRLTALVSLKKSTDDAAAPEVIRLRSTTASEKATCDSQRPLLVANEGEIEAQVDVAFEQLTTRLDDVFVRGSGFALTGVTGLELHTAVYVPLGGASHIAMPQWIQAKKCIVNVQNKDNQCFKWAMLSALHYDTIIGRRDRISSYERFKDTLNFDGIDFPVTLAGAARFSVLNEIPLHIFGLNITHATNRKYRVEHVNRVQSAKAHVVLLRVYTDAGQSHYAWIRRLNAFSGGHCCVKCLHKYSTTVALANHVARECHGVSLYRRLPPEGQSVISFTSTSKQLRTPFVIYADVESMLVSANVPRGPQSAIIQQHTPTHIGALVVSKYSEYLPTEFQSYTLFNGPNCVDDFLIWLHRVQAAAQAVVDRNEPLCMTPDTEEAFAAATQCSLCQTDLNNDRVRDHDHITGQYRGAAHRACNLHYSHARGGGKKKGSRKDRPEKDNKKPALRVPIFCHNMSRYDGHLFLQHAGKHSKSITAIAKSADQYIAFTIDKCLEFKDSLHFMSSSLDNLASNLHDAKLSTPAVDRAFVGVGSELRGLLKRKGVFPYDWYDSSEKLLATALPPKDAFFSRLSGHVSEEDYTHALRVWDAAGCTTFEEYLALYLKLDVVLLSDIFEAFRTRCHSLFSLDPCHYYTLPGFAWDAMLRMTRARIECFHDEHEHGQEMLEMTRKALRGGVSVVTTRHATANNVYLGTAEQRARFECDVAAGEVAVDECEAAYGFDPHRPSEYLLYLDANNLYGGTMREPMPIGGYVMDMASKLSALPSILALTDDAPRGCFVEVDLHVPPELHDFFNDLPLAPEATHFGPSPTMEALRTRLNLTTSASDKLIPNLTDKVKYVLHYRNLKQYVALGLVVTEVHRVLWFDQVPFMRPYVDFCTQQRAAATNTFDKNLFKLLVNAIFGKTCENVERRVRIVLLTDAQKIRKYASRTDFQDFRLFSNDLVAIHLRKTSVVYNRPFIIGAAILDLSKTHMYGFHYGFIKDTYGDKARLLFTDTDSLVYSICTNDVYEDMRGAADLFDTSDYPTDHPSYSAVNKKVVGKFKDELNGEPMREFVGLRAKMYCFTTAHGTKAKAKGIKTSETEKLRLEDYKAALFSVLLDALRQHATFNVIRAVGHMVATLRVTKASLCALDDKRYVLPNNVNTLAYGHWRIAAMRDCLDEMDG